jgi:DNA modification methylase
VTPFYQDSSATLYNGDCSEILDALPQNSVQTCITSPPYWHLRNYQVKGQLGLEPNPLDYVAKLVDIFRKARRVLRKDATVWLNLGDSYILNNPPAGFKTKDLVGVPWRVALALQADGWYLRSDCIWSKPNPVPSSVEDRPTRSHEYVFLLSVSERYYYDGDAIAERAENAGKAIRMGKKSMSRGQANGAGVQPSGNGLESIYVVPEKRNKRTVWTVPSVRYPAAHFATFPPDLIKPCILAGSRPGDTVLDPFAGSGTTLEVAKNLGRHAVGIELSAPYCELARDRIRQHVLY